MTSRWKEISVLLDSCSDHEVREQTGHSGGRQLAVHAASHARNFVWVRLFPLQAAPAEGVKAVEYFGVDESLPTNSASGVETVELAKVTYSGVARGGEEPLRVRGDKEPRSSEPIELAPGSDSRDGVREAIFRKPASLEQVKENRYNL